MNYLRPSALIPAVLILLLSVPAAFAQHKVKPVGKKKAASVKAKPAVPQEELPVDMPLPDTKASKTSVVIQDPDEMPAFDADLNRYLMEHIHYPDAARESGVEGRVGVRFIVRADGSLTDIKIVRGVSKELNEEVLRVIRAMPEWKPGKRNGKPVDCVYTLPVTIELE